MLNKKKSGSCTMRLYALAQNACFFFITFFSCSFLWRMPIIMESIIYQNIRDLHETDINFRNSFSCIDFTPSIISPKFPHCLYSCSTMEWSEQSLGSFITPSVTYRLSPPVAMPIQPVKGCCCSFCNVP